MFGELTIFQFILPLNLTWFLKLKKLIYLLWTPGFQNSSSLDYNVSIWSQRFTVVSYTKIFRNLVSIKIIIIVWQNEINKPQPTWPKLFYPEDPTQPNLTQNWALVFQPDPKLGSVGFIRYIIGLNLNLNPFWGQPNPIHLVILTQRPQPYLKFGITKPS